MLTQNHGEKMLINENMTGRIINACFEVHNELGNGCLKNTMQILFAMIQSLWN